VPTSDVVIDSIFNEVLASEYNNLRVDALVMYPELTNRDGGTLVAGSVVIVDVAHDESFITTTDEDEDLVIGVLLEDIADAAAGLLVPQGAVVNTRVWGAVTRGNFLACGTVAGRGVDIGGSLTLGTFGVALEAAAGPGADTILARMMLGKTARHDSLMGMMVLADAACPEQWTDFVALQGKYPKGAESYGGTGGAASHTHDYTDLPIHTHTYSNVQMETVGNHTHGCSGYNLQSVGSHSHKAGTTKWTLHTSGWAIRSTSSSGIATSAEPNHNHGINGVLAQPGGHSHYTPVTINNAGTPGTLTTDPTDGQPPYLEMIFCEKITDDEI